MPERQRYLPRVPIETVKGMPDTGRQIRMRFEEQNLPDPATYGNVGVPANEPALPKTPTNDELVAMVGRGDLTLQQMADLMMSRVWNAINFQHQSGTRILKPEY